jgi:hypothetical protein
VRGESVARAFERELRENYDVFLSAIASAATAGLDARTFPTSEAPIAWEHVLPWVSRDQECRFADFVEWRHSGSDADAPALTADERHFMVRAVLDLVSDKERLEQLNNARLTAEKSEATALAPITKRQARLDAERAGRLVGEHATAGASGLFADEVRSGIRERQAALARQLSELGGSDELRRLRGATDEAVDALARARHEHADADRRLALTRGALAELEAPPAEPSLLATLPPARGFCDQPMTVARAKGCPNALCKNCHHARSHCCRDHHYQPWNHQSPPPWKPRTENGSQLRWTRIGHD